MKRFLKGIAIFVGLAGVGVISAFAVIALLLRQEEVRVPDLTGQDIVATIETVNRLGLQLKVERREAHPTVPRDRIISQSPQPGGSTRKGRPVRVVVSLGSNALQAPYLIGEQSRKAEIMIRTSGFQAGRVSRTWSDEVARDTVIGQDPAPGSTIEKGGTINILVSAGKKRQAYAMPNLLDRSPEEAVRATDRLGLQHRVTYRQAGAAAVERRTVVSQKPLPGHPVTTEDVVEIVVSR